MVVFKLLASIHQRHVPAIYFSNPSLRKIKYKWPLSSLYIQQEYKRSCSSKVMKQQTRYLSDMRMKLWDKKGKKKV